MSLAPVIPKLGCVGLGALGLAIAENLIAAQFEVTGFRRSSLDTFKAAGGVPASSPAEVMKASDIIVTCLPSKDALQEVICGPAGLERHARSGQIVIDSTTAPLSVKARLRDILAEHGVVMLDCPISGRPNAVRARQAAVFVSGDEDAARLCGPVFDAITDRYSYLGSFGAGTKMKFIANLLVAVHSMAAAEAVEIGTRAGFSVQNIVTALGDTAAWSEQFHIRAPVLANAQPSPNTSASIMFLRDMRVIDDFVTELGSVAPLFSTALSYLEQAERAGYGGRDSALMFAAVLRDSAASSKGAGPPKEMP